MSNTLAKNEIAARYLDYWKLDFPPFGPCQQAEDLLWGASAEEALARLEYLADREYAGALLVGAAGVGKTLLLRQMERSWRRRGWAVVKVNLAGQGRGELVESLAYELGIPNHSSHRLWQEIQDRLKAMLWSNQGAAILLDDLGQVSGDISPLLKGVGEIHTTQAHPFLVGICRYEERSHPSVHRQSWYDWAVELRPWQPQEVATYVRQRLIKAGREPQEVFADSALDVLSNVTGGIPRDVARLAEWCLLVAAGAGVQPIDAALVSEVFEEFYSRVDATRQQIRRAVERD